MIVEVIELVKVPQEAGGSTILADPPEPLTLAETKQYLRISSLNTSEDSFIEDTLIPSARETAERHMDKDVLAKKRKGYLNILRGEYVNLHFSPIASIEQISSSGKVLVKDTDYRVEGHLHPKIYFNSDNYTDFVFDYTTKGVGVSELRAVKPGILAIIAEMYRERDGKHMSSLKSNWKDWLANYKNYGFYGVN